MISNWSELPIGIYQQIYDINNLHCSDDEKDFRSTALLAGMNYNDFLNLRLEDVRELSSSAAWVYTEPKRKKVKREYHIGNTDYRLMRDVNEMTTAQYIDFQTLIGEQDWYYYRLPELMAIVLIPKGCEYNEGYNHNDTVEEIREYFNVEDALSVADFFCKQFEKCIRRLLNFSVFQIKCLKIQNRKNKELVEALQAAETALTLARDETHSIFG